MAAAVALRRFPRGLEPEGPRPSLKRPRIPPMPASRRVGTGMVLNFRASKVSLPGLRRWLIVALTGTVIGVTLAVSVLVQRIFDNFGPGVASDLDWKTQRGAQELARAVDLGLAVQ